MIKSGIKTASSLFVLIGMLSFSLLISSCGKSTTAAPTEGIKVQDSSAIIGRVDWISVSELSSQHPIYKISQAVGLISIPNKDSRCTAFLISPSVVMTNWHCFPTAYDARDARLYLNFLDGQDKEAYLETDSYACSDWLLANKKLDVALIRCEGEPGIEHGTLTLEGNPRDYYLNDEVYVIHQNCDYYRDGDCAPTKKVSLGKIMDSGDAEEPARSRDLFYSADTLGGSSGSPVFSRSDNKVVAIHHNGHGISYNSVGRGDRNSGIPMVHIVQFLRKNYPQISLNY